MTTPAKMSSTTTLAELRSMVIKGDLSKLSDAECEQYIILVCERAGLRWETRPLEILTLGGKKVLYSNKDCANQLRQLHGISLEVTSEKYDRGMLTVTVRATDKTGRVDEDIGAVPFSEKLAPEFAANMKMKAVTKAKRRVTLSISGFGWLDETEVEDISQSDRLPPPKKYHEPESGPNMTRKEAIDISSTLLRQIREAKDKDAAQRILADRSKEMLLMHRDQTEVYDRLVTAVDKEMAEHD